MITNKVFNFLEELSINNNREWFQIHKSEYQVALKEVEETATEMITGLQKFDSRLVGLEAKKCIFRIYRDVRFSKDKVPYKDHFGVFISPGGKNSSVPGYYLHIQPGESFIGGGVWMPPANELFAIRQEIYYNYEQYLSITENSKFKDSFPTLDGTYKNIKAPKGFESDFEGIDILKNKCYFFAHNLSKEWLLKPNSTNEMIELMHTIYPFNQFLQQAIENIE